VGDDDVRVLDRIDLYEVSLTPWPMNPDTEVLSRKSMTPNDTEFKALSLAAVRAARRGSTAVGRPDRVADRDKEFEELRRRREESEEAKRAQARRAEEEAEASRLEAIQPRRRSTIVFTGGRWKEYFGDDAPTPTPEQIKEREAVSQQQDASRSFLTPGSHRHSVASVLVDEEGRVIP